jgi:DNA-binding MarR family transcriptional regulator
MKKSPTSRGPRPGSIARVEGIDYADLDQHFGYALKRAQIASFEAFSRATAGEEITPPRYTALVILAVNPGISQSALGEVLGTARSGAMMLADWLEQRGLAERRHKPDDARAWGLFLTAKGEALLKKLKRNVRSHDRRFAEKLAPAERRELLRLLEKLADPA